MKKTSILSVFIMLSLTIFGQDIIIEFAGEGASTAVTTVEVVNLSNCTSIDVPGDSALNLTKGEIVVGIEEFENLESSLIQTYPNPFESSTNIEFSVNQMDYVTVTVYDISGKLVSGFGHEMNAGTHSFEFIANNPGIYFINISGTSFVHTSKVVCTSNSLEHSQLIYNEKVSESIAGNSYKSDNSKNFSFTEGDMLKLKGISGDYDYATIMTIEPSVSATYTFNFVECTDGDGNNYAIVEIGTQTWMAENMKTSSYAGGDDIPLVEDNTEWANLEDNDTDKAYCFYNNDPESVYGALYTYAAATNGDNSGIDVQGICPTGWHVPSDGELTALTIELGGESVAGGKVKSICTSLWDAPNTAATNESGLSVLPAGGRAYSDGMFFYAGISGDMRSSTQHTQFNSYVWKRYVGYHHAYLDRNNDVKSNGFPIRCIRD